MPRTTGPRTSHAYESPAGEIVEPAGLEQTSPWIRVDSPQRTANANAATTPAPHASDAEIPAPTDTAAIHRAESAAEAALKSLQHIHTAYAAPMDELATAYYQQPTQLYPNTETIPPTHTEPGTGDSTGAKVTERRIDAAHWHDSTQGNTPKAGTAAASPVHEYSAREQANVDPETAWYHETTGNTESEPEATDSLADRVFQPVWEVDAFDVPPVVADLFFEPQLFQQIAQRIGDAVQSGLGSVLVTSVGRGEGRSSVAIGMAMAAAAAGIRVALVDADMHQPTLADDLHLDLQYGWIETVRGGLPIQEVAVHAVEDGLTLIPLMSPETSTPARGAEVAHMVALIREHFDLVIIDGPCGSEMPLAPIAAGIDSAIIVRDMTRTDALAIQTLAYRCREAGVRGIGVVENFTEA